MRAGRGRREREDKLLVCVQIGGREREDLLVCVQIGGGREKIKYWCVWQIGGGEREKIKYWCVCISDATNLIHCDVQLCGFFQYMEHYGEVALEVDPDSQRHVSYRAQDLRLDAAMYCRILQQHTRTRDDSNS